MTKVIGGSLFCLAHFNFPNQIMSDGDKLFSQHDRVTPARLQSKWQLFSVVSKIFKEVGLTERFSVCAIHDRTEERTQKKNAQQREEVPKNFGVVLKIWKSGTNFQILREKFENPPTKRNWFPWKERNLDPTVELKPHSGWKKWLRSVVMSWCISKSRVVHLNCRVSTTRKFNFIPTAILPKYTVADLCKQASTSHVTIIYLASRYSNQTQGAPHNDPYSKGMG